MSADRIPSRYWRGPQVIVLEGHRPARGYVTRAPLPCQRCGGIIAPGSTVTLHAVHRHGDSGPGSNKPVCWHCRMFVLLEAPRMLMSPPA